MSRLLLAALLLIACRPRGVVHPGPSADADEDGLPDSSDACPAEAGAAPDGCPERGPLDLDGDGIVDGDDRCPDSPEVFNRFEDEDGCPDDVREQHDERLGVIRPAQFAADAVALAGAAERQLDQLAALLTQMPRVRLMLSGHADARERSPATLSRRRAEAVRDRLIAGGVAAERLEVRGAGADEPIGDDETEEGRAKNRRVDLTITAR